MFIQRITIQNFRLFPAKTEFEIDSINVPDAANQGSGLNVFVGENASGKTSLLDAFVLPLLEFKSENFSVDDFNDPNEKVLIRIFSNNEFTVGSAMPKGSFISKGFQFEAGVRASGNKAYLSSIVVSDQLFIKSDPLKPKDGSPDLRVNVNNPFAGKRFSENDILFLDRNRLFQTRSGNFNTTRFDRLMEDFSYQYLKNSTKVENLNDDLDKKIKLGKVEHTFLADAVKKFNELSGENLKLDFLNNYMPFRNAFFSTRKDNHQQIPLSNLGSGYEMIFALLYSFYLAKQSNKQLIAFIDEPELHLHPRLQEKFVKFLLEISKDSQLFLTSHSPLLIKQLSCNDKVKIRIIEDGEAISDLAERFLPYISANETNFIAFNLATEEYHNELYEELKSINGPTKDLKPFDKDFFVTLKGEAATSPWKGYPNEVSIHTFIRNQIHHQKGNGKTEYDALKSSIEKLRTFF